MRWLDRNSGLDEFVGGSYEAVGPMHLYRASDLIVLEEIFGRMFLKPASSVGRTVFSVPCTPTVLVTRGHSTQKGGRIASKWDPNHRNAHILALDVAGAVPG